ncbi:MAG TPA: hypothetical protein VK806_13635 [Bacteroidia bacterium]|jgi:hypothetical protein|nr:hypothetical protein [Bacteroidia bacterium]
MANLVQLYVEGKSDKVFFEGAKFKEFATKLGYVVRVKNLKTRGNVLTNCEKYLKLSGKNTYASLLVYDKDQEDLDISPVEKIIKKYDKTFQCVAIQELEAWFLADHEELKKISRDTTLHTDTQCIAKPKEHLRKIFSKAGKGHKTENGLAEHFANKIDLLNARAHNKSLDKFLRLFEGKFIEKGR